LLKLRWGDEKTVPASYFAIQPVAELIAERPLSFLIAAAEWIL